MGYARLSRGLNGLTQFIITSKSGKLALIGGTGIAENPRELRKRIEMIIDIKDLCDEIDMIGKHKHTSFRVR